MPRLPRVRPLAAEDDDAGLVEAAVQAIEALKGVPERRVRKDRRPRGLVHGRLAWNGTGVDSVNVAAVVRDGVEPVVEAGARRAVRREGVREEEVRLRHGLCGIPPLVLGYPKNSSKIPTAVKSNSFPTILGPFVFAPRVLDD